MLVTILGLISTFFYFIAFADRETTGEKFTFGCGIVMIIGAILGVLFLGFIFFVSSL